MDEVFGRRDMIAPAKLKALSVKSDLARRRCRSAPASARLLLSGAALSLSWGGWLAVPALSRMGY